MGSYPRPVVGKIDTEAEGEVQVWVLTGGTIRDLDDASEAQCPLDAITLIEDPL